MGWRSASFSDRFPSHCWPPGSSEGEATLNIANEDLPAILAISAALSPLAIGSSLLLSRPVVAPLFKLPPAERTLPRAAWKILIWSNGIVSVVVWWSGLLITTDESFRLVWQLLGLAVAIFWWIFALMRVRRNLELSAWEQVFLDSIVVPVACVGPLYFAMWVVCFYALNPPQNERPAHEAWGLWVFWFLMYLLTAVGVRRLVNKRLAAPGAERAETFG